MTTPSRFPLAGYRASAPRARFVAALVQLGDALHGAHHLVVRQRRAAAQAVPAQRRRSSSHGRRLTGYEERWNLRMGVYRGAGQLRVKRKVAYTKGAV